ncbi:MAG: leucyl aminopeptidase family protein, partial [Actinomycetospora chiangmaiensis]|nr:leucyl aminopeptidase family protein [Actinomycetospora chiangmaiensis]
MPQAETQPMTFALLPTDAPSVPVTLVTTGSWGDVQGGLDPAQRRFAEALGFKPKAGNLALLPGPDGGLAGVLFGLGDTEAAAYDRLITGKLPGLLPEGSFRLENAPNPAEAALAWLMGSYRFGRYRSGNGTKARLAAPAGIDAAEVERIAAAVALGRDLINTPANDMGPAEIEAAARSLAERHGATIAVTAGEALAKDYP